MYTAVQITNTNTNWWHLWQCAVWAEPAGASNWNLKNPLAMFFRQHVPPTSWFQHFHCFSHVMFQNLFIYVQLFIWRDLHALHMYFRIRGNPMQAALSNSLRFTPTLKSHHWRVSRVRCIQFSVSGQMDRFETLCLLQTHLPENVRSTKFFRIRLFLAKRGRNPDFLTFFYRSPNP